MEEKIKKLIDNLKSKLDTEIVAIIYNPLKEEGIKDQDCKFLYTLLEKNEYVYPLFLLSGNGGDFIPGLLFPGIIKKHVDNYKVYIPGICGSALCYTIFQANELLVEKKTRITQIDPTFNHNGETLRAIRHLRSPDDTKKDFARKSFDLFQKQIKELSAPPSIFDFKKSELTDFELMDLIVQHFMNKEFHESPITVKEMKGMSMKIKEIGESDIEKLSKDFVETCQDFTIKEDVRVIFVSSIPFELEKEGKGSFICPLK